MRIPHTSWYYFYVRIRQLLARVSPFISVLQSHDLDIHKARQLHHNLSEVDFASESNGTPMGERRKSRTAGKRVMNAVLGDVKTHAC